MNSLWYQIPMALLCVYILVRMWPTAIYYVKNGPRGSSKEWLNVSILLAAVVLFVTFLITVVSG